MATPSELSGVPETALWTLRNRAMEAKRPDSTYEDPVAVELFDSLGAPGDHFGAPSQSHSLRARAFDDVVRGFLAEHPGGTVVALGEGLQTSFWRIGDPKVRWLSVDLPEMISLREKLLPAAEQITHVAASAFDRSWMDKVDAEPANVLITAEGLLMYFERDESLGLIRDCAARFPGGAMVFDSIPAWLSRRSAGGLRRSPGYIAPPMPFSLSRDEAAALPATIPGVASAEDLLLPRGRGAWARIPRWVYRAPVVRNQRPVFTLLTFG